MALALKQDDLAHAISILVVEDDSNLREALTDTLQLAEYHVIAVDSAEAALRQLAMGGDIRMIVSDVNMGGMSGHALLRHVKQDYPQIPLMLITAYASIKESVEAMQQGAVDYLVKPFAPQTLVETVARHLGVAQFSGDEPVAEAASSRQLLQLACRVAQSDSTVLIVGESGTGKEVLARYIHDHSQRRNQPFIAINCAAIPENMLEAMLFGHEKGAYTGAHTSSPGKFEQANGGTLLLDEISEMDIGLQAKLLRVLQEREVERLGGRKTIKLDVRVIATSNRDMRSEVVAGKFREDLYYRLSVLPLQWAPLRDRIEDIVPLAERLLHKHAHKQNRRGVVLSMSAKQLLMAYAWPGNVRELDNIMQRALILQPGRSIEAEDLGLDAGGSYQQHPASYSQKPNLLQAAQALQGQGTAGFGHPPVMPFAVSGVHRGDAIALVSNTPVQHSSLNNPALGNDLKQREYEIIMNTLRMERGSRKNTAERLGISARTLRYKIARLREEGYDITE
ncbi:sigma-54-dependent transcriptional regulator [Cellvibrio japonicus]|uniref:Transcriptional activator n=1 Tax=Cellvibrio japonicus (strain Ueda107) TaxID=498211 RepID=B3PEY3_CELJU|nr:sigma-54 dependent transcriptional regulator [Cellvibrio japonicus]ACE83013.1 transcriptional activator [Cellvibrio japonicus Ueda107]QEI12230.1 sigma-54-dependent Fis family transcriptional regulator [Cellvibrio japonicus]QEI15804.1 sigma-54-dependent Fis family transcriptional regulator [Cellvibrio japonicus]QEI19382.1 sigma-54-dependent Fis family transcriptional regulator [Cellvibrio japonicus]